MNDINLSIETLLEILGFLSLLSGVYMNLNNRNIRHDERIKNLEKHCNYLSEDHKQLRQEVNESYEILTKTVHDNSLVLEGLRSAINHVLKRDQ